MANDFFSLFFMPEFLRMIASFVGASVIGHSIMAGNILANCSDLLSS